MPRTLKIAALALLTVALPVWAAGPSAPGEPGKADPAPDLTTATKNVLPLSPEAILDILKQSRSTKRAAASTVPTKLRARVINPGLAPGAEMSEISVRSGYVTTITLYDSTGAAWPVERVVVGYEDALNVAPEKPDGSPLVHISPKGDYPDTSLVIVLKGLPRPLTFRIIETTKADVDAQIDVRVPALGPNATPPIMDRPSLVAADDPVLMSVLQGIPPEGAMRLVSSDPGLSAWRVGDDLYVRTSAELLSPAYRARLRSSDGTAAYLLADRPILLVSNGGQAQQIQLTRK